MLESSRELVPLIRLTSEGDQDAFQTLYRATSAKLYGIVLRVVVQRSTADEILQEVYVKIWQRAGEFDPAKASPITWMATIARNRAIDEVRRTRPDVGAGLDEAGDVAAEPHDPLGGREHSEALRVLLACLKRLPDERRDIIMLAYCRGMSREAIGKRLNRPVPTIKTWLHRSLADLRTCLAS